MKNVFKLMSIVVLAALAACGSLESGMETPQLGGEVSGVKGYGEGTQVKLYYAKVVGTGFQSFEIKGYVEVKKAAGNRQVVVHYVAPGVSGDQNWHDVQATYLKDAEDPTKEIWAFVIEGMDSSVDPQGYARFAVKYAVNGVNYWDNNGGYDYWLSFADQIAFGKSNVALDYAYYTVGPSYNPYPPQFTGYVYVKDLAYDKVLQVTYTTNNWKDTLVLNGNYQSEEGLDGEVWWFSTILPYKASSIKFAVHYTTPVNNSWDNNFKADYVINGSETIR